MYYLQGLAHLHANRVIHRDIKGQNILLTDNAEVKLGELVSAQIKADIKLGKFVGWSCWVILPLFVSHSLNFSMFPIKHWPKIVMVQSNLSTTVSHGGITKVAFVDRWPLFGKIYTKLMLNMLQSLLKLSDTQHDRQKYHCPKNNPDCRFPTYIIYDNLCQLSFHWKRQRNINLSPVFLM